jgi:hypothetical protein
MKGTSEIRELTAYSSSSTNALKHSQNLQSQSGARRDDWSFVLTKCRPCGAD